jgi:hypothetical protein
MYCGMFQRRGCLHSTKRLARVRLMPPPDWGSVPALPVPRERWTSPGLKHSPREISPCVDERCRVDLELSGERYRKQNGRISIQPPTLT